MRKRINLLMSQPAIVCHMDDCLHAAAKLMWDHDCGALPVINSEGRVVAMLTDRDICMASYTQGCPLHAIKVSSVMSRTLYACGPDDTVEVAEKLMRDHKVRRLPVVSKSGQPLGLVSLNDLARASASGKHRKDDELSPVEVASTLAAISEPRLVVGVATAPSDGA